MPTPTTIMNGEGEGEGYANNSESEALEAFLTTADNAAVLSSAKIAALGRSLNMNNLMKVTIHGLDNGKGGTKLTDSDIISFTESVLKAEIHLIDISFKNHWITDVGLEEIARLFKPQGNNKTLEGLDLEANEIKGTCFHAINLTSKHGCPLVYFNISCNPINSDGRKAVANIILNNKILRQISINSIGFDLSSMILMLTNLGENNSLQLLSMDRPLTNSSVKCDEVADHLGRVLTTSQNLYDISMRYFNVLDHGAHQLAQSLILNDSLMSLNLECNNIGIRGAEALASYLILKNGRNNGGNSLKSLGMAYNRIGDDGAIAFAEALLKNSSLETLTLRANGIGQPGLEAILTALERRTQQGNGTLKSLTLFSNDFSDDNGKQLSRLLEIIDGEKKARGESKREESKGSGSGSGSGENVIVQLDVIVDIVDGKYLIAEY